MKRHAEAAIDALRSGRFVSRWSLAIASVVSLTVMAPDAAHADAVRALGANLAATLLFVVALGVVGAAERISRGRCRLVVVVGGLLTVAALRPWASDRVFVLLGSAIAPPSQLPFRVATNILAWLICLTTTAIIVRQARRTQETNARLTAALAELARVRDVATRFEDHARTTIDSMATELVSATDRLGAGGDLREEVRRLGSEHLRAWSHELAILAERPIERPAPEPSAPRTPRRVALRLPPRGALALAYVVCVAPFALREVSPLEVLTGLTVAVICGTIVDDLPRRRRAGRRARMRSFLSSASAAGVMPTIVATAQGVPPALSLISTVVFPALAAGLAASAGAMHALSVERRRLTAAIRAEHRTSRIHTRSTRNALRDAAALLHRDGQGRCVHFALTPPTPRSLDELREEMVRLADTLRRVFDDVDAGERVRGLDALIDSWSAVIPVKATVTSEAQAVLAAAPAAADDAFEVVAEGLLNAVKHSIPAAAEVSIDVIATGAGRILRVRVLAPGALLPGSRLRPGSPADLCGAQLIGGPGGALLHAMLVPAGDPFPVVSAEHPRPTVSEAT